MTTFLIDTGILGIVAFCAWRGYRNGLIRGAFGIVTLIISLFLANTIATAYKDEFSGVLTPFVGGVIESALSDLTAESIIEELDDEDPDNIDLSSFGFGGFGGFNLGDIDLSSIDLSGVDLSNIDLHELGLDDIDLKSIDIDDLENESRDFLATFFALRHIGMPEASAVRIAQGTAEDETERFIADVVADNLSSRLTYIALFGISFLLLAIIFAIIGNLIGFIFTLPGLKLLDIIAGIAFGLIKGILIILTLTVVIRYFGLLAYEAVEATSILKYLINNNLIANILGV